MNQKYTPSEKQAIIDRHNSGESVAALVAETGIPRSTLYAWFRVVQEREINPRDFTLRNFRALEKKVTRLEGIIKILKKADCTVSAPLQEKLFALESFHGQYSVHMLCEALEVPRGTFYNHILRNKRNNTWYSERRQEFREVIQRIYDDSHQIFGAEKIYAIMKEEGYRSSVKMVRELMHKMGLYSIRQDAKDLYDREHRKTKNYLNQHFMAYRPNEMWVSDITYFHLNNKTYYICVILDLYARKVVAYRIGKKNSTQLVKTTFRMAYESRQPELSLTFHTDRGSNYLSKTFRSYLQSLNVNQSFSRAHTPHDNSPAETFFSSLKREELYRTRYRSENEFRAAVDKYITFYNEQRPHSYNQNKTPVKKEEGYYARQALKQDK